MEPRFFFSDWRTLFGWLVAAELTQDSSHLDLLRFCSKSLRYTQCCDLDMHI